MSTPRKNGLVVAAVVAALLVVVGVGWVVQSGRDTTGESAETPADAAASDTAASPDTAPAAADTYGVGIGDPEAPAKVEIFEDFLCPFCADFESASQSTLREAALGGEAFVVYRPIAFLDDYSARALNAFGVVLDEHGGEVALAFHDLLFENQPGERGALPDDEWLIDLAVEAGADEDAIRDGIEGLAFEQWMVNANDDASQRPVNATPTVFVDGEPISGRSIDDLLSNMESAIADAQG